MPGYGADQVKLGFFSRDFLFQFVSAGRLMLGKDVTVALAKNSDCWHAINHTRQKDHRYSGMYRLAEDKLEKGWQQSAAAMMGTKVDLTTNQHLYALSFFVQKVKEEVGITGSGELDYKVKIGLVATVADYVQMPHLDCAMHANKHSWIFHVPICKHGMYLYIWDVDAPGLKKTLVHIPFGSFLVLRDDVWHGGIIGGEGNVRVHGGIFEAWTYNTLNRLVYPPKLEGESLINYRKSFDRVHNRDPIDYKNAISMVTATQLKQLEKMALNLTKSFSSSTFFYAPLPSGVSHD